MHLECMRKKLYRKRLIRFTKDFVFKKIFFEYSHFDSNIGDIFSDSSVIVIDNRDPFISIKDPFTQVVASRSHADTVGATVIAANTSANITIDEDTTIKLNLVSKLLILSYQDRKF